MKTNFTNTMAVFPLLAVMLFATGCKKPLETKVPMVTILENSEAIGSNTAVLYAEVTDNGGAVITERGFCYGKVDGPIDTLLCDVNSEGFSVELEGLSPSTAYVCQAFAGNEAGRGYSSEFRFTTEIDTVPRVKTWYVREITYCSAVASGQVLGNGGQVVEERGICYGTESLPTVDGMHVEAGSGMGPFDCLLSDLLPETRYYVRAYVACTKGVYYGHQLEFDTNLLPMEVRTIGVSDVTASRVRAEGEVIRDGGSELAECGFCWGTEHNPTMEGLHINANIGVGNFAMYFSGLERGQTYYVRAYAVNEEGVAYGEEVEFVPDDTFTPWSGGSLPGLFSVSKYHQVRFSQGNLQYCPNDDVWRFAEHQWDFVGGTCWGEEIGEMNLGTVYANGTQCDNTLVDKYYEGWIDLFGWGTSGWNNGNTYYKPYDSPGYVYDRPNYGPPGNYDLTGEYARADWGVYNTVSNGGSRQWRTLSSDEFMFLLTERVTPSGIRFAMAAVAGVRGMVVLPDDWNESTYALSMANEIVYYDRNNISGKDWLEVLEPAGAVFLPAGGDRFQYTAYDGIFYDWFGNQVAFSLSFPGNPFVPYFISGEYWTTSQGFGVGSASALRISCFGDPDWFIESTDRCVGCSVRLISDESSRY